MSIMEQGMVRLSLPIIWAYMICWLIHLGLVCDRWVKWSLKRRAVFLIFRWKKEDMLGIKGMELLSGLWICPVKGLKRRMWVLEMWISRRLLKVLCVAEFLQSPVIRLLSLPGRLIGGGWRWVEMCGNYAGMWMIGIFIGIVMVKEPIIRGFGMQVCHITVSGEEDLPVRRKSCRYQTGVCGNILMENP